MVMTGIRAAIQSCLKCVGRHIDLYCLTLVVGYGLTRALLNLTYGIAVATINGLFSLLEASLHFPVAASASIAVWGLLLAIYGCQRPNSHLVGAGVAAVSIQTLINAATVLGLFPPNAPFVVEMALPILWGMTSVVANVAWLSLFVKLSPRRCVVTLASCILFSSFTCMALGCLSFYSQGVALVLIGIVCVGLFLLAHRIPRGGPALPSPALPQPGKEAFARTLQLVGRLWSPLLVFVGLSVVMGFVSAFLDSNPLNDNSLPRNIGTVSGAALTAILAIVANRMFDLRKTFQAIFPPLVLVLTFLPFIGSPTAAPLFYALLGFFYTVAYTSTLFLVIQTARVQGAPVVASLALFMGAARACLVASLVAGAILGSNLKVDDFVRTLVLMVAVIYILSMVLAGLARNRQGLKASALYRSLSENEAEDEAPNPSAVPAQVSPAQPPAPVAPEPQTIEQNSHRIASLYRLTPREVEIAVLLAQGRSMPYIATKLGLSGNTVRSYAQETYAKLGVHSKQELIDLFTQGEE